MESSGKSARWINRGDTTITWSAVQSTGLLSNFNSKNRQMRNCLKLALEACKSRTPLLITGDTGTGKSLLAKSIHYSSPDLGKPCETLSCARLAPETLREELFGVVNGDDVRQGVLERANGGTLILDEIEMLPIPVQPRLLNLLDTGRYRPEGNNRVEREANVRIIATSSSDLSEKAANGSFLLDLIYSLGEITLRLPALRDRQEDMADLVERGIMAANKKYGKNVSRLSKTATEFLKTYKFPGNIRELNHLLSRAVKSASRETIYVEDLGVVLDPPSSDQHFTPGSAILPLQEMEKRHIALALGLANGNLTAAARALRITNQVLERKLRLHGLESLRANKTGKS